MWSDESRISLKLVAGHPPASAQWCDYKLQVRDTMHTSAGRGVLRQSIEKKKTLKFQFTCKSFLHPHASNTEKRCAHSSIGKSQKFQFHNLAFPKTFGMTQAEMLKTKDAELKHHFILPPRFKLRMVPISRQTDCEDRKSRRLIIEGKW